MKVVSYGLWGDNPKYCVGAVRNAEDCAVFYPDWVPVFYHAANVPRKYLDGLVASNPKTRLISMPEPYDWTAVLWRFQIVDDGRVDTAIFRDTDSRISVREVLAVRAWEESSKLAHIMRDHPQGHRQNIMPGMFGLKRGAVRDAKGLMEKFGATDRYGTDYVFFDSIIYPIVKDVAMVHDEFFDKKPFPSPRRGREFVGQVFDEFDRPNQGHASVFADQN